jgi:hypothetical protein
MTTIHSHSARFAAGAQHVERNSEAYSTIHFAEQAAGLRLPSTRPTGWQLAQADEAYRLLDRQTSGKGVFLMWGGLAQRGRLEVAPRWQASA